MLERFRLLSNENRGVVRAIGGGDKIHFSVLVQIADGNGGHIRPQRRSWRESGKSIAVTEQNGNLSRCGASNGQVNFEISVGVGGSYKQRSLAGRQVERGLESAVSVTGQNREVIGADYTQPGQVAS